jgi:hypothetical protein
MKTELGSATIVAVVGCVLASGSAHAICRVVEPASDSGPGVEFDPTTTALAVRIPDAIVDYDCAHAGPVPEDWPEPAPDKPADPTRCWDGSYGEPVRGAVVSLVVRPALYARGGSAGLIMPLPGRGDVQVAPDGIFDALAEMIAPRVHETTEFIEDPSLGWQCGDPHYSSVASALDTVAAAPLALYGCGSSDEGGSFYRPGTDSRPTEVIDGEGGTVVIERIPATPDYDVAVLNASTLEALYAWMDSNGFAHAPEDDDVFARYVATGRWFVAVNVHPPDMGGARVALAPLVVSWLGREIPITHELQYDPRGGFLTTDLFVIGPTRMATADGSGVTELAVPQTFVGTALEMFGVESGWVTRLRIDRLMNVDIPDTRVIPAAYWEGEVAPVIERTRRVYIAAPCCPDGSMPVEEGAMRTHRVEREYGWGEDPSDAELWYHSTAEPEFCGSAAYERYGAPSYPGWGSAYDYTCSTTAGRTRWITTAASWLPLLLGLGILVARSRRRR